VLHVNMHGHIEEDKDVKVDEDKDMKVDDGTFSWNG